MEGLSFLPWCCLMVTAGDIGLGGFTRLHLITMEGLLGGIGINKASYHMTRSHRKGSRPGADQTQRDSPKGPAPSRVADRFLPTGELFLCIGFD